MSELTSDELRQYMNFRMGGMTAYRKREIQKILNIAIDRAEAAEQLADKHWQTIIERNKTITARDVEIVEWQENYDELETMFANCKRLEAQAQDRIAELEAQLAAQAWRPMENVPHGQDVELLVHGYIGDDGLWYYRDGTTPLKGWRPID